jgi:hypothetical protein
MALADRSVPKGWIVLLACRVSVILSSSGATLYD